MTDSPISRLVAAAKEAARILELHVPNSETITILDNAIDALPPDLGDCVVISRLTASCLLQKIEGDELWDKEYDELRACLGRQKP